MTDNMIYVWDNIVDRGIATSEELGLACALCGCTEETLNKVINIRTGYQDLQQILDEEEEED